MLHIGIYQRRTYKALELLAVGFNNPLLFKGVYNRIDNSLRRVGECSVKVKKNILVGHFKTPFRKNSIAEKKKFCNKIKFLLHFGEGCVRIGEYFNILYEVCRKTGQPCRRSNTLRRSKDLRTVNRQSFGESAHAVPKVQGFTLISQAKGQSFIFPFKGFVLLCFEIAPRCSLFLFCIFLRS